MKIAGREYITYAEASEILGVSRPTLRRLIDNGVVVAYRPGLRTLLDVETLEAWFKTTIIKPRKRPGRPRKNGPQAAVDRKSVV